MTRFPPWLAQVEANLATRKCLKSSVFVLAFHLGLSRWERIWSHDIQTGSHQSRLPVRQARRVAKTRLHSRFLVNSRGPHPPCEEGSRVCNPSFVNAAPNLLPPGQASVESLSPITHANPDFFHMFPFSRTREPETSKKQLARRAFARRSIQRRVKKGKK